MYLKEIQAYGFKSFADKINFEFTNNINGIVGPNGSGKSNVVDAVRWVLGEQSNKSLRASDSTSVIFSGSKSRKALNSAIVNIIFDNTDRGLPIDFNEVSIKRILYRTGENEYYLNGEKCRLKDIADLLMDSGAAKESFNIIGQGKIDEILTTKPSERRIIFEEAAGVLKYKKRKEEAIRKLERTNNNINRVNDIITELEGNIGPLEQQSQDAKNYLECKDKLTNYDISLMIYDVDRYTSLFNEYKNRINELNDKIMELNANNTTYDISILQGKDKLSKLDKSFSENSNRILELTRLMEQTDADIRIFRERKKYVATDKTIEKINDIQEKMLKIKDKMQVLESEISLYDKKISDYQGELDKYSDKISGLKGLVYKNNNKLQDNTREITDLNYKISSLEENINNGGNVPYAVKCLLHNPLFSGVYGTIGSLVKVENEYALALSTSLGGASNYLVVDDRHLASRMVEYLKSNKLGRATFFPMDVIKARYVDVDSLNKLSLCEGYINTLDKLTSYDEKYREVILNQLGNVIVSDNIINANKMSKIISNKYKIVTLDGQVVNVGGSITGGDKVKSNDLIKLRYELEECKNRVSSLINSNNRIKNDIDGFNKEISGYEDKIYSLSVDRINAVESVNSKNNIYKELEGEYNNYDKEYREIESIRGDSSLDEENNLVSKYYQIKEDIERINKDNNLIKLEREKLNEDIASIEDVNRNSSLNISKLERELKDIELKSSKLEVKIDQILNSLNEDYSITYNEAKDKYILLDDEEEVRREVNRLKEVVKEAGMVNLGAIAEYERVSKRYDFLKGQRDDLNKAEETLLEIIRDMDNIMKEKFVNTFEEVRVEFKKVFRELFKGGEADIYMLDPDNVLETGIELEATPPGKKLKSIQALSGGEKTFTAISLLFAILNVRPVPFCLFDEVEAALDDANVIAFSEYLDKYRDKTQFIIITHKKKTMEFIDTLYGITMQESGVSKKVSVKLGEVNGSRE